MRLTSWFCKATGPQMPIGKPIKQPKPHGRLFFTADDGTTGRELWTSDGTPAGTVLVRDINAGASGSFPQHLTAVGDSLYFTADDGTHGRQLWQTVQQAGGGLTAQVAGAVNTTDFNPLAPTLANVNGRLFFTGDDGTHGRELWTVDTHQPAGTAFPTVTVNVPLEDTRSQNQDNDTQSETSLVVFGSKRERCA